MVSRLFIFEFFQGAAIATYFFAAIALFVHRLPATELPKVFILSSFLLWIFGFVYSQLEHRLLTRQLILFVLIFNTVVIVGFRAFINLHEQNWFLYVFLASFNVLYLLNNLEFWGLVALLFDVRQSKRLFSIVSAWDGPARLSGYVIAFLFTFIYGHDDIVNTKGLLLIASLSMLVSLILFIPMSRSRDMQDIAPVDHHHYATHSLHQIQTSLTGNLLIRNAAFVSFFSFCFYLITNFVLYGYLKKRADSDQSMYIFVTAFLIISRAMTLVIKPLFINRLLDRIGIRKSLLIAPVTLFVLSCISALANSQSANTLLYLYLIMAVTIDVMRSSIQSPVLLATLQPLPTQQRLRGHTIIKGLMDPFAFLASGLFLLKFAPVGKDINLLQLSIALFALALLWIFFAFSVDSNYIKVLTAAIRKRILQERDISITDVNSLNFLLNRIEKGNEEDAIAVLNVVSSQPISRAKFYFKALQSSSDKVKLLALRYVQSHGDPAFLPELRKMLDDESSFDILPQIVLTIASLDRGEDLSIYFDHENQEVSNAAVIAWLTHDDGDRKLNAENHINRLFEFGQHHQLINALQIVGDLRASGFSRQVTELIAHENDIIRFHAIQAAGKMAEESMITQLLDLFLLADRDKHILEALQAAGELAIPLISGLLHNRQIIRAKRVKLFALAGRIGGGPATAFLEASLYEYPADSSALIGALYQLHFTCGEHDGGYRQLLVSSLAAAASMTFMKSFLRHHGGQYALVVSALKLELASIKTNCLHLFSFMFDAEKIRRAKAGFDANSKESIANAFELIQMTVSKEFSVPFLALFEQHDHAVTGGQLRKLFKEPLITIQSLIRKTLVEEAIRFTDWTKASLLYTLRDRPEWLQPETVQRYLDAEDPILQETARYISERNKLF